MILGLETSGTAEDCAVHIHAATGAYTLGGHREVDEALGFVDPTDLEQETEVALAALAGCIKAVVTVGDAMFVQGRLTKKCRRDAGIHRERPQDAALPRERS